MLDSLSSILIDLIPYFQFLGVVDFGLLILGKRSATVQFQRILLNHQKEKYAYILKKAGELTSRCQERRYGKNEKGGKILGMAKIIRSLKEAFVEDKESEKQSAFMPAMGITAGMFCLLYMFIVPFLKATNDIRWLYGLEYLAEAVLFGQIIVIITYVILENYRDYFVSLRICFTWTIIDFILAELLYFTGNNLYFGDIWLYVALFLIVPLMPFVFMLLRLLFIFIDRKKRAKRILISTDILEEKLNLYKQK